MKKILGALLLFFSLSVHAQTGTAKEQIDTTAGNADSVEVRVAVLPDSGATGAADGNIISKQIGSSGGKIISEDGRIELIFPAGALSKTTNISIQPIVNLLPNGNGKGYQFEPSGTRFIKPVEIIFHYSQKEDETCPAQLHFMAIQNKNGKWEYMNYEDWDSVTKALKGHITHFSAMVDGNEVELQPRDVNLRLGDKRLFYLELAQAPVENLGGDELSQLPTGPSVSSVLKVSKWSAKFGTFVRDDAKKIKAIYSAPRNMPPGNKDEVTLNLNILEMVKDVSYQKKGKSQIKYHTESVPKSRLKETATFTSTVHLNDVYRVFVTHDVEYRPGMGTIVADASSFDVDIFPASESQPAHVAITNIQRYTPDIVKKGRSMAGCKLVITPVAGTNSIYITTDYKDLELSNSDPPEVSFEFPAASSEQTYFLFHCAGKTSTKPEALKAFPLVPKIKFIENGLGQSIDMKAYKILVSPLR